MKLDNLNSIFSDASIISIYAYYDMPLIYVSRLSNKNFINVYVDTSEKFIDRWLIGEISNNEYNELHSLKINLRTLLENMITSSRLFNVYADFENKITQYNIFDHKQEEEDILPRNEFKITYDYLKEQTLLKKIDIIDEKLTFAVSDAQNRHEIQIGKLSPILNKIKDVYNSLFGSNGTLSVLAFSKGSFGITVVPEFDNAGDLFGKENMEKLASLLFNIWNIDDTIDYTKLISNISAEYGEKALISTNALLKTIKKYDMSLKLKVQSNDILCEFNNLHYPITDKIEKYLASELENQEEQINIIGELQSINISTRHFSIEADNGDKYTGYIEKDIIEDTSFTIPSTIEAHIKVIKTLENDEVKESYTMTSFIKNPTSN